MSCVYGEIYYVIVDFRCGSATYKQWYSLKLNSDCPITLRIPPGFGTAYLVLSAKAIVYYKWSRKDANISTDSKFECKWNDKELDIQWPISTTPLLSERDS
jgi:dTDP-4-dehydrorhamnose 3,5-epimerase